MVASAHDPLRVPAQFWQRDDVVLALEQRDIGRLFRLLRQYGGVSQTRIGTAVGMTQSAVSLIARRGKSVIAIAVLERIADGLVMPDDARMRLGLAPKEADSVRRRTALGLGMMAALSPATLATVLRESAAEAMDFTRHRTMSSVGAGTLDHLTTVVAELDRSYPWRPATELFPVARAYRQRVQQLLDGKHTLAEARELHVHGAYLSSILSDLADNLGSTVTARAYAIDSFQLAEQAGHGELCAWAASSLAFTLRWTDKPAEAIGAALKGLRNVPRRHPLAARLHVQVARGHASRGDWDACVASLRKARSVCDRLPTVMPSRLATDTAEHVSHTVDADTAETYVVLGDWLQAQRHARTALGVARWSPRREANAHLDLSTALTHLGSPEEAAQHGERALAFDVNTGATLRRAHRLNAALMSRYPNEPSAKRFHEQYRQLASLATTN